MKPNQIFHDQRGFLPIPVLVCLILLSLAGGVAAYFASEAFYWGSVCLGVGGLVFLALGYRFPPRGPRGGFPGATREEDEGWRPGPRRGKRARSAGFYGAGPVLALAGAALLLPGCYQGRDEILQEIGVGVFFVFAAGSVVAVAMPYLHRFRRLVGLAERWAAPLAWLMFVVSVGLFVMGIWAALSQVGAPEALLALAGIAGMWGAWWLARWPCEPDLRDRAACAKCFTQGVVFSLILVAVALGRIPYL